jgi:2-keto-3-deoxy-L-rhamnonate aldolase RhmA
MTEVLVGTVLTLPGATASELLAEPFDVVWLDLEHASLGPLAAQEMAIGAQAAGALVLVRLPAHARELVTIAVDAGVDGVVLADVRDAAAVTEAARWLRHPPEGIRGWGPRRAALRGRRAGGRLPRARLWAQIESRAGVAAAPAIAAAPGLEALVVGTADLSYSLGAPLDLRTDAARDAIAAVRDACEAAGIAFGLAGALDGLQAALFEGASILIHSTDAALAAAAVDVAATRIRDLVPRPDPPTLERVAR